MKKLNKIIAVLFILLMTFPNTVFAAEAPPEVVAQTAILGEVSTGKIIYQKDMDKKMYPASMTKLLTAIVALEHLKPDDLITVGSEINEIPADSSKAGHTRGETLTVKNLIRGLLIPSGNDSANVLAVTVARKIENNQELPYEECIKVFTELMNQKAKQLGATNSHFANAHGYHDENHYTTAHDMFFISQEALKNETIAEITKEKGYSGDGVEGDIVKFENDTLNIKAYNWTNHNLLVTDNEYQYEYVTGLKTGFTDEAGDCLSAAAQKDDITLIAVVFHSEDPARWTDTRALFEYGFSNFDMLNLQKSGDVVDTVALSKHNRLLGDTLNIVVKEDISEYMLKEEVETVEKVIEYKSDFVEEQKNKEDNTTKLKAPISTAEPIGKITYKKAQNEVIKETDIYAEKEVEKGTILTTIKYFFQNLTDNLFSFSLKGVAVVIGIVAAIIALLAGIIAVMASRRNRRRRSKYIFKTNRRRHSRNDGPRMRRRRRR
ncbi:MAG: D-alanyl-D-alanine carboxypeptidase [Firmicutes bacterium]|nr:D-alanyl-D-alanine carboxypeptidase [Bacillota bacterium]